jgi:tRNA modification GTPase
MIENDTIAANITAPGMGAMGALRLSGPLAYAAAAQVFQSKRGLSVEGLAGYSLAFGGVYIDGAFLDQALLLKMKGPHSFTGEDVAELQCHGGPVVMSRLLAALTSLPTLPVRPAQPGEFSQRAFLNGKIDLSQAEAVMELVAADNPRAAAVAADQLGGSLSRQLGRLKDGIVELLAEIDMEVDFPEEGQGAADGAADRLEKARRLLAEADEQLAMAERGRIYRDGVKVVFFGRPNVGKSSLLNGMLRAPRAIVTPEPGTTRDVLEERILMNGVPLVLTDTAGVRNAGSLAEQAGVARARQAASRADLILYVVDMLEGITGEDEGFLKELGGEKTLLVFNKKDLVSGHGGVLWEDGIPAEFKGWARCGLSALEDDGIQILADEIRAFFEKGDKFSRHGDTLLNRRQGDALRRARQALAAAAGALEDGLPEDMAAIDLKQAWTCLGELTGESLQAALVEKIFSTFCLGK